ncbi:reverse transcriptase domain-containing protein [Tanacetum coccineum]
MISVMVTSMEIHHSKANTLCGALSIGQNPRFPLYPGFPAKVIYGFVVEETPSDSSITIKAWSCPILRNHQTMVEIEVDIVRRNENEEWIKKLQETTDMNIRNRNAALKNLETQVDQLSKDFQKKDEGPSGVLPCQPPPKELSLGSFTLPCTIGSLNMYALADLSDSVNIRPYSMFKCLKLTSLKETSMLVEMADMSKKVHMGIVENVLAKIDKFVFPSDFVVIDMLRDPNETMILGRPFLATIHARRNVFRGEILLGIGEDRIMFDINGNVHHPTMPVEKVYMANSIQEEESLNPLEISDDLFSYDSPLCLEFKKYNHLCETNKSNKDNFVGNND